MNAVNIDEIIAILWMETVDAFAQFRPQMFGKYVRR